jgi:TP901 family phage tail tape measure protein
VNELNKALTEIAIVTGQTQQQVAKLGEEYNKLAYQMGVTTTDVAKASVEFMRQGLSQEEAMKRVQVATEYAKISSLDFNKAAEILTATTNSMNVDIQRAADVFAYLGDATATSASEIGEAFQKVGGSAGALGLNFEKISSWIAVLSSRTRESASTIGKCVAA